MQENDTGDVGQLLNSIERLAVRTGAAVAFGAHFSKGNQAGKESIDRISGSGVFARDPDSILVLTRHEEERAFTLDATLRNLPPVEPFVVRWQFPLMLREDGLDPTRLKQAKGRGMSHDPNEMLTVLPREGLKTMEWMAQAKEELGIPDRTFHKLKKRLTTSGIVTLDKISNRWRRSN